MDDQTKRDVSVVIAGGGPTGLMLAGELALAGVDVAIVERRETQELAGMRAGGLHARTIEVLDQRGIAERFLAIGRPVQVASFAQIHLDISDFPTRHNYALALPQNEIERVLADWVFGDLGVPSHRGVDVTGLAQDEGGVDVLLSDGRSLRAQYLVGCDGGRSTIRKKAGIEFPGWDATMSSIIAEVEMAEPPAPSIQRDAKGVYAIGPLPDGKRVRAVLREEQIGEGDPTEDELRGALVTLYGTDFGLHTVVWLSRFTDAARQAARYRDGRVLLAGDAAHVHSPVGGQGLNLGVQDAVNLAWKLGCVVRGEAPSSLLDTYHAERHPIGARVLRINLAATALSRVDERIEAVVEQLTKIFEMEEPRKLYAGLSSGLELRYDFGEGHPLLGRRMPDLDVMVGDARRRVFTLLHDAKPVLLDSGALEIDGWSDRVRRVGAHYEGVWDLPVLGVVEAPRAVLIRPDGYVAWVGDGTDAGLCDALTKWFGPAREG